VKPNSKLASIRKLTNSSIMKNALITTTSKATLNSSKTKICLYNPMIPSSNYFVTKMNLLFTLAKNTIAEAHKFCNQSGCMKLFFDQSNQCSVKKCRWHLLLQWFMLTKTETMSLIQLATLGKTLSVLMRRKVVKFVTNSLPSRISIQ
jgi:hypothetical protein